MTKVNFSYLNHLFNHHQTSDRSAKIRVGRNALNQSPRVKIFIEFVKKIVGVHGIADNTPTNTSATLPEIHDPPNQQNPLLILTEQ